MNQFQTGLPSVRQIQGLIKDATTVEIKLMTNELLSGILRWQDQDCIGLLSEDDQSIMIWRNALVYIKPLNGGGGSRALQVQEETTVVDTANLFEGL